MNTEFNVVTHARKLDTAEFAEALRVRPRTIRRALCVAGCYLGARPTKLSNGRLLWDAADLERILSGEQVAV